jgi:hypothetical protein
MGYAPDWNKGSMKKSGATPVKQGVTSRELFHGAKQVQRFDDGGAVELKYAPVPDTNELNIKGEKVGYYTGNDEIAKYRMNMTDDVGGKSLRYKDNPDMQPEKPMSDDRPYNSIEEIIADKATKPIDPGRKFIADTVKKGATGSTGGGSNKSFAKKADEAKPYDPSETASGMGRYIARDLGMNERLANFTANNDYVSATDVAATDFMKRRGKAKK